ncbi:hypothetical protein LTR84_008918 [Exophiala bonariae]|uniref:Major facilitator superfamily (MFS) profile domain-containing protein n=1 Tax=Exophiala bonariae TaxID=1690606 RepID=A0AAV9MZ08_9EURO|nr:hypothetical protein LTR84_008918 [Exophiala bonariae]
MTVPRDITLANIRSHQGDPYVPCSCTLHDTYGPQEDHLAQTLSEDDVSKELEREKTIAEQPPIPNGGMLAWLQVLGSFFLFFNSWGITNAFGAFQTYYNSPGGLLPTVSNSNLSWIGSLQAFLMLVVGIITGPLYDAGYFRHLLYFGSFLVVFGMMMTSLAGNYWEVLLAQAVTIGVGSGCLFIPSVAIMPQYFTTRKVIATGIAASGSAIAGVIYPIVFYRLQPQIGFPWTTRVLGFMMLATLSIPIAVMRVRVKAIGKRSIFDKAALKEPPYVLFTISTFFLFAGTYIPFFYMPGYGLSIGMDPDLSFYTIAMLNAASTFGRLLPSYIADRAGPLNVITPFTIITAIIAFTWTAAHNLGGVIAISLLYGLFSGALVSLPPSTIVHLSPKLGAVGTRMGMTFFISGLGLLAGNPIAGAILGSDNTGFLGVQLLCACCVLASGILMVGSRVFKAGVHIGVRV